MDDEAYDLVFSILTEIDDALEQLETYRSEPSRAELVEKIRRLRMLLRDVL